MRKYLLIFCAVLMLFTICSGVQAHAEKDIDIVLNGQYIPCDSPPQIRDNRTVVPISSIVKPLGGTADFNGQARTVAVAVSGKSILFTLDSSSVLVDGVTKQLDTPAVIIKDRTMVPVRFLAEELGYEVRWGGVDRTVYIDTPQAAGQISDVWVNKTSSSVTISIQATGNLSGFKIDDYKNPERTVVDFPGIELSRNFQESIDAEGMSGLRSGSHEGYARIVVDLTRAVSYTTKLQNGNTRLDIRYQTSGSSGGGVTQIPPKPEGKIRVVIDPGHGGSDPGTLGKDKDGNTVMQEKNPNLSISIGVYNILSAAGYDVIMTRYGDEYPSLKQRADIANNYDADLFICIHNNASDTDPDLSGTMTFYSGPKDAAGIGKYNSKELAKYIQTELVKNLGTRDLNVREGHDYYVINKTNMTAVLIEVSYVSNEAERAKLADENYLNLAARSIAEGIMKATGIR